uniref:Aquaporin-3-like isoform X2 n=1 Tax=Geotrypetes seraphini TaxID=260995 RepID=A0A6P8Q759_GEOSA|nr:aquaporin-3-like isoform X2 [Geotrypetes seraphini]
MGRQKELVNRCGEMLRIHNKLIRQFLSECLGTLILVMFGCGSVAQVVLSKGSHGQFLTVNLAFGFAVMLGILISGQVSDAIWYFANDQLYVMGPNGTAGIFATYPTEHLTLMNGFFDQFIGTAALVVCVLAIVDPYNNPVPRGLEAFTVGFVVLVIGLSMGFNSGYAVNPARDFGPRLFTSIAGWGTEVFSAGDQWWWVPIVSPLLGAVAGVLVYELMIGFHVEPPPPSTEQENVKLSNVKHKDRI